MVGPASLFLQGHTVGAELEIPVVRWSEPLGVRPSPERGVELGHVVEERQVLIEGNWLVPLGHQRRRHVTHEQRRTPAVASQAGGGPHDSVVDGGRQLVQDA